jgi:Tol biopolymer transport system component
MPLISGTKLGPYEIVEPLGAGGMGEVYRARDSRLDRLVAIKILPPEYAPDTERVRRFEQEARATAALNHPNILAVYDINGRTDFLYIVSELLEGETLRRRLASGALPSRKAVEYATQIALGLAAAHEKGVIHRDLKPENIFVTKDGRVKILDFGLAKLTPVAAPLHDDRTIGSDGFKTGGGQLLGTMGYMSPEQVRGRSVDYRSDLFSFGAVLYEMLCGRRAFRGSTPADTASAILKEDPAELSVSGREVSPALDRIVRHCLEKNPEERFQSARDLAFDLQNISGASSQSGVIAIEAQRRSLSALRTGGLTILGFLLLAAVFWAGWSLKVTPAPSFKQLTFRRGYVTAARFAPDGQNIIYSAAWDGNVQPELFSTRIDSVLSRSIEVRDADVLAISSQSEMVLLQHWRRTIGWQRSGMLARMALSGGAPRDVLDAVQDADWSSDGANLAVIRAAPQYQIEFPVGHLLATAPAGGWLSDLRVSPDQHYVAYFEHPLRGDDRGMVCLVDRDGRQKTLSSGWSSLKGLAWSASGNEIWFTGSNSGGNRRLNGVTLSGRLRSVLSVPGLLLYDISLDGRVLLAEGTVRREMMGLTPGNAQERNLSWLDWSRERGLTPDGQWLLFDEQAEGGGANYSIYLRKTDGSPAVRLGDNDAYSISNNGKWILATTKPEGGSVLLMPTGAGETHLIDTGNLSNPRAFFLPDQKHILISTDAGRWYVQALENGTRSPVTPPGIRMAAPTFTADGRYLLARDPQLRWALYPIAGGQPVPVPKLEPTDLPIVHTTDNHSFFIHNAGSLADIYRFDVLTGSRQLVRQFRPTDKTGYGEISGTLMTPDGKYYVYGATRELNDLFVVSGLK